MLKKFILALTCIAAIGFADSVGNINLTKTMKVDRNLSPLAVKCIECHKDKTPGIVNDWKSSRHAHAAVSCVDCHAVPADSPMAIKKEHPKDSGNHVSILVSPKTCAKCHAKEVEQFQQSGHARGGVQMFAKKGMVELMYHYEANGKPYENDAPFYAGNENLKDAPASTGCIQCHGMEIKLDKEGYPLPGKGWPNYGIGNAYPDGSVGSCKSCHSSHKFDMTEARKPSACASCHLGPDHPNIEIYNNSMHGKIFNAEGNTWKWDSAPDTWDVPDYRAPTCATCHMSGIGDLNTTHNVSVRLKWNLWAPHSNLRTGGYDTAAETYAKEGKISIGTPLAGNINGPEAARTEMKQVCKSCHSSKATDSFFVSADNHVELYNTYHTEAKKMLDDLKAKGLLKKDEWSDEFQITYYYLWHHQGRRMRMGAVMGAPDYAHWHGVFEVQQDIKKLRTIYDARIKSGKIE
ncbi:beta-ketoacyl-ACP synthase [Campylobacter fetus]|uniref:Beta-ketoacyl-ACP synthase n=3 Tax=Campylobacter fetus TaxID=196 RepID=A0A5L4L4Y2_CAMFE|nr:MULTISPECIES: multiheme c-type cytochrome [Campylobacter]OCS23402.1 beta-ketoacyl-ACP synthase [Campylobacter fetus subsp. venerealis cfvi97/532]OCS26308.1 beta-ketoacyl-ACP synthase [Campylobacter fetus subsp. venerealis cfvB10]OCS30768.1 beta-ketoacyl-ACP synthase [Campylobacter fetus subsp. venerealis LMG 6570 = CCUG 33900]OCS43042.1 beta-ketoacyl-ACP synthase [Campylobacter fetus subsp. venerealis cfvi02/298]ABK81848.1 hydroxylamine oxidase [Campylobacter fetus subsp. fetus 82-40]